MRARIRYLAVVVAGLVPVAGFAALIRGALITARGVDAYRVGAGLPPREGYSRWALAPVGYAAGVVLSLLVVGLAVRWWSTGRHRRALTLALLAGIALGLLLALDGLVNITPDGDLAGVVPSWYAPLSTAQGLIVTAVCGLAVIGLPSRPPFRT
jgi:hypothetical protein